MGIITCYMNTTGNNKAINVDGLDLHIHDALVDKLGLVIPIIIGKIIQRETIKEYHFVD